MPDHHMKGQPAASTYIREKGGVTCDTIRVTPCTSSGYANRGTEVTYPLKSVPLAVCCRLAGVHRGTLLLPLPLLRPPHPVEGGERDCGGRSLLSIVTADEERPFSSNDN